MTRAILFVSLIVSLVLTPEALGQSVTIGGFQFEADGAADSATLVSGSQPSFFLCGATAEDGEPTLPGLTQGESATRVVSDANPDDEVFGQAVLDVGFADNVVVNDDGPDLVVFESGRPESFTLAVFNPLSRTFSAPTAFDPVTTGYFDGCGFMINAAQIDLGEFGVAPGTSRALFRIDNLGAPGCCAGADLADVLALRSGAPAPQPLELPGVSFEANAGADVAMVVPGSVPSFFLCGATPEAGQQALPGLTPDASATLVVSNGSADDEIFGRAVLDVRFTDNVVFNGDGADLVVFESGRPEAFEVAVFDPSTGAFTAPLRFDPVPSGLYDHCGFPVNAAQIDVGAFGIARSATVSFVRIDNLGTPECCEGADLADVRAIHSAVEVKIAVKPGTFPAPINPKSEGVMPVAIFSTSSFDATSVDPATVVLGDPLSDGAAAAVRGVTQDLNGDGHIDRLLFFNVGALVDAGALNGDTTRLVATGKTFVGLSIIGGAAVRTVPAFR